MLYCDNLSRSAFQAEGAKEPMPVYQPNQRRPSASFSTAKRHGLVRQAGIGENLAGIGELALVKTWLFRNGLLRSLGLESRATMKAEQL